MGRRPQHESQRSSFPNVYSLGPWLSCVLPPQKKHHPPFESLEPFFFHNNFWVEFRVHWKTFLPKQKQIYIYIYIWKQPINLHPPSNQATSTPKKIQHGPVDRHQSPVSRSCSRGTEHGTLILGESTTRRGAMQEKTGKHFSWCKCRKLINPKRKVTVFFLQASLFKVLYL